VSKRIKVAEIETTRDLARRIVAYELNKAFGRAQARELMADSDLEFVEIRRAETPRRADICSLFVDVDRYGLGQGVYPKAHAPAPPHGLSCSCAISPRLDLTGRKPSLRRTAELDFVRSLSPAEAIRLLGSAANVTRVLNGHRVVEVWNAARHPLHAVVTVERAASTMEAEAVPGTTFGP
jgi:hypothetical protein